MIVRLHSVAFSWDNNTRLEIEWSRGRGKSLDNLPPIKNLTKSEEECDPEGLHGVPAICWRHDAPALFESFQLSENTEYFIDITLPISIHDAQIACAAQPGWPFNARLANTFHPDPARRWRSNENGTITIPGRLNLRDHAGLLDLSLNAGATLRAEVVCKKIGYLEEFRALLDGIAEEMAEQGRVPIAIQRRNRPGAFRSG